MPSRIQLSASSDGSLRRSRHGVSDFRCEQPGGIAVGPDGALWFTDGAALVLLIRAPAGKTPYRRRFQSCRSDWRITTDGATETPYPHVHPWSSGDRLPVSRPGASGSLKLYFSNKIGVTTTDGAITAFLIPTFNSERLDAITAGSGRRLCLHDLPFCARSGGSARLHAHAFVHDPLPRANSGFFEAT